MILSSPRFSHFSDELPVLRKEHEKQHCDQAARVNGKWLEHDKQRVTPLTLSLAAPFWAPPTVEFEVHGPERGHYRSSLSQHNEQWQQLGISPVFLRKHSRDPALQHYQAEKLDAQETNKANGKCQCRECQHRREEEVTNRNQRFIGTFPNYTIGAGAGTDLSEEDCSNKTTYGLSQVVRLLLTEESGGQRLDHDRGSLQRAHDQSGGARPMNPRTQSGQLERVIGGGSQGGRSNSGSGVSYPFLDSGPEDSERYGYQSSHFYHPVSGLFETTEDPPSFSLFSNLCKLSTNYLTQSEGARPKNPRTQSGQLGTVRGSAIQEDCSNSGSGWGYSLTDRGPKDSERFGNQSSHFDHPVQGLYDTTEKPMEEFSHCSRSTIPNRQSERSLASVVVSFGGGSSKSRGTEGDSGIIGRGGVQSRCSDHTGQNLDNPAEDTFHGLTFLPCPHQIHHECALRMIQEGLPFCHHCWMPLFETLALE